MRARVDTIKNRRDFLAANARASKYVTPSFILQANQRASDHPAPASARIGYTVTKKMGDAVTRNRIKRRLREALKRLPEGLMQGGTDYVLISRNKAFDCEFSDLVRDMEIAFSRIHAKKGA